MESISFWCERCALDVEVEAGTRSNSAIGTIKYSKCPKCKKPLYRFPSNVHKDPYFVRSREVKIHRKLMKKDILQVNDPLFDIYYPEHKRKENERLEKEAREQWEKGGRTLHL